MVWPGLFSFNFYKYEFEIVVVDDVVFDTCFACVGLTGNEFGQAFFIRCFQAQFASDQGHNNIVILMYMPAGFSVRRKAPLRDNGIVIINLYSRSSAGRLSGMDNLRSLHKLNYR